MIARPQDEDVLPDTDANLDEDDLEILGEDELESVVVNENGDIRYRDDDDEEDESLEEDDDNPYQESDEALPDDDEERALRRNPSGEGGRFGEA